MDFLPSLNSPKSALGTPGHVGQSGRQLLLVCAGGEGRSGIDHAHCDLPAQTWPMSGALRYTLR